MKALSKFTSHRLLSLFSGLLMGLTVYLSTFVFSWIGSAAFAQAEGGDAGSSIVPLIFGLALYVFGSYCMMVIATKLNVPNPWLAWIPLVSLWIFVQCAGKPVWWIVLLFIPLVNIVIGIILLFSIPPRLGKSGWLALLILVPFIGGFIYYGLLAFT